MTRGMKGCYIYCTDHETAEYFRARMGEPSVADSNTASEIAKQLPRVIPFKRLDRTKLRPFRNAVPLIDLKVAAGLFSHSQLMNSDDAESLEDR